MAKSWDSSKNRTGKGLPAFGAKKTGAQPLKGTSARKLAKEEKKEDKNYAKGKGLPKFGQK